MSNKKKIDGYPVLADFEYGGKVYHKGEAFTPPAGVKLDPEFDQFLKMQSRKAQGKQGMSFVVEIPPAKKDEDPEYRRFVLPVE